MAEAQAEHTAATIVDLINRSPRSPTKAEIAQIIQDAGKRYIADGYTEEGVADGTEPVCWPALDATFDYTNEEFAKFLPATRLAFNFNGKDHVGSRQAVRDILDDKEGEEIIAATLADWE